MALGVGSMTVSHANDSYFWIVTQMSGMDIKTAYKTHTLGTLIQGSVGLLVVWISYWVWSVI
jgi:GntP family gluconate:H+ symporter